MLLAACCLLLAIKWSAWLVSLLIRKARRARTGEQGQESKLRSDRQEHLRQAGIVASTPNPYRSGFIRQPALSSVGNSALAFIASCMVDTNHSVRYISGDLSPLFNQCQCVVAMEEACGCAITGQKENIVVALMLLRMPSDNALTDG